MKPIIFTAALLSLLTFAGCGTGHTLSADDLHLEKKQFSLQMFGARSFINGIEYERFTFNERVLWQECGTIDTTPERSSVDNNAHGLFVHDPHLRPKKRETKAVSTLERLQLKRYADRVLREYDQGNNSLPAPGSVESLTEPGYFELEVLFGDSRRQILTSIDGVAEQETPLAEALYTLFSHARSLSPKFCGQDSFFGIGASY